MTEQAESGAASKLAAWVQASRPPFFIATLIPIGLGAIMAWRTGYHWDWDVLIYVIAASFLVHLNTNLANDIFDHIAGADAGESIGGSRVIQQGLLTMREIAVAMFVMYVLAGVLGLAVVIRTGEYVLLGFMLFAALSSLFYTAPPIKYGYRRLGEVMVFLNMGPVMVAGTYIALARDLGGWVLLVSVPVGITVALILFWQSLPDMQDDLRVKKHTMSLMFGQRGSIAFMAIFGALAIFICCALPWLGFATSWAWLASLAFIPLAKVLSLMTRYSDWRDLDGKGRWIRLFYLIIGISLIVSAEHQVLIA